MPNSILDRFMSKVVWNGDEDECWTWAAALNNRGYGGFRVGGTVLTAHRAAFEFFVGPIPDGLVIDHLCRNRACVNPTHLEAVTNSSNLLRGEGPRLLRERCRAQTHCKHGHEFTPDNTYIDPSNEKRKCRKCVRSVYPSTRRN